MCSALLPVIAVNDQSQLVLQGCFPSHLWHLIQGQGTRFSTHVT